MQFQNFVYILDPLEENHSPPYISNGVKIQRKLHCLEIDSLVHSLFIDLCVKQVIYPEIDKKYIPVMNSLPKILLFQKAVDVHCKESSVFNPHGKYLLLSLLKS